MASTLAVLAYRYLAWTATTRSPYPFSNGRLPKQTPPIRFPIFVYSHRGGNLERDASGRCFIENTLPAFNNSVALGADLLELDVQLTRDGMAAVFHDKELGRLCGSAFQGKCISDFNYAELPRLSSTTVKESEGSDFLRIPLLEEVFRDYPNVPIQIDLKVQSHQLVRVVGDLIKKYRREHLVLWGSFLHSVSNDLYNVNPNVPLFTSAPRAYLLLAAYYAGRLEDVHIYESAIIMPWRLNLSRWLRPSLVLPRFFHALNARGVSVVLFGGINDEAAFMECTAAGANALCTDNPSRLLRWLASQRNGVTGGGAASQDPGKG